MAAKLDEVDSKIYEVDPLICPRYRGEMRIIAVIEDEAVIKKILKLPELWETRSHGPPARDHIHMPQRTYDDDYSQIPPSITGSHSF